MGMVDSVSINCHNCGKNFDTQSKILGGCIGDNFEIGSEVFSEELKNCTLKLKGKCDYCNKENAIKIRNGKIISVENPAKSDCIELPFGVCKIDDLKNIINLKLEKNKC